MKNHVPAIYVI